MIILWIILYIICGLATFTGWYIAGYINEDEDVGAFIASIILWPFILLVFLTVWSLFTTVELLTNFIDRVRK